MRQMVAGASNQGRNKTWATKPTAPTNGSQRSMCERVTAVIRPLGMNHTTVDSIKLCFKPKSARRELLLPVLLVAAAAKVSTVPLATKCRPSEHYTDVRIQIYDHDHGVQRRLGSSRLFLLLADLSLTTALLGRQAAE